MQVPAGNNIMKLRKKADRVDACMPTAQVLNSYCLSPRPQIASINFGQVCVATPRESVTIF